MSGNIINRGVLLVLITVWLTAGAGCRSRGADQPELATVSGVVTLDGEPLSGVLVTFAPEQGRASSALTDAKGAYELMYLRETKGAKIGKHTVSIRTPPVDDADPEAPAVKERVPAKYNTETTLSREVSPGANTFDFELESK